MLYCQKFIQLLKLLLISAVVVSGNLAAQGMSRAPASYIPDDDLIIVPTEKPMGGYELFFHKNENKLSSMKSKMRKWLTQHRRSEEYGMIENGLYNEINQEARLEYLKEDTFKFFRKSVRDPLRQAQRNEMSILKTDLKHSWNSSDEIDSKDEIMEDENLYFENGKASKKAQNKSGKAVSKKKDNRTILEKIVTAKKDFRLTDHMELKFKPRVTKGYMLVDFKNPLLDVHGMATVNEKHEVSLSKNHKKIGLVASIDYKFHSDVTVSRIDKTLFFPGLKFRLSNSRSRGKQGQYLEETQYRLMFRSKF